MHTVHSLTPDRAPEVAAVFCDAFHRYPVMSFVVGPGHPDYDRRLTRLIDLFVQRRVRQGAPVLGVEDGGQLVAAATMTPPGEPAFGADLLALADAVWGDLGEEARARYVAYVEATQPFFVPSGRHHHLNMIGVRASHAGRGLARPLLDAVAAIAREDPASTGISLTTEVPRNLTLYQHFGYEIVAHARVAPELETWGLFRRAAP
jgi:GNAT superfamily N-acetyltransferase